ncbi:MAG TPA: hypothetical protein DIW17_19385 [Clostridiales bacterium]|nr:hypothetical protein [Clostridiales bacterium]
MKVFIIIIYYKEVFVVAGEKKFGSSMFGFKRADVNAYIERIIREFDHRLREKDEEIATFKLRFNELQAKYDQLSQNAEYLIKEKEKIAGVLLQAQEKAETMMVEAQDKALKEKVRLDHTLETEREKIVDIKRDLKSLKSHISEILTKFESELNSAISNVYDYEELYVPDSLNRDNDDNDSLSSSDSTNQESKDNNDMENPA